MRQRESMTQRERLELMITALFPAAMGILGSCAARGGRLAWALPLLVLPAGFLLAWVWRKLGPQGLPEAIGQNFSPGAGRLLRGIYLLWGLWILAETALNCTDRLLAAAQLPVGRVPLLAAIFLLTLWLGQSRGRYVRTGRIFYLTTAVTLGAVGLLAVPSLQWENLLPPAADPKGVLLGGGAVLSLAGYGIYGICQPVHGAIERRWGWITAAAGVLSAALFVTVGALGPALAAKLDQPFLYILRGVGVPGAFQRGEAVLAAVLAQADLVLLGLLAQGCAAMLTRQSWGRYAVTGVGAVLALILGTWEYKDLWGDEIQIYGGIILGIMVPFIVAWKSREGNNKAKDTIY